MLGGSCQAMFAWPDSGASHPRPGWNCRVGVHHCAGVWCSGRRWHCVFCINFLGLWKSWDACFGIWSLDSFDTAEEEALPKNPWRDLWKPWGVSKADADETFAVWTTQGQSASSLLGFNLSPANFWNWLTGATLSATSRGGSKGESCPTFKQKFCGDMARTSILYKYIISVFYGFQEALASQLRCVRGVSETVARSLAKKHSNMKSFISAMMDAEDPVLLSWKSMIRLKTSPSFMVLDAIWGICALWWLIFAMQSTGNG